MPPVDIDMQVRDRNIDALPALQVYTTKVLKPNTHSMQCQHKNVLTQEMLGCEDCKYVIKWKYDLNGQTVEIPENCILEFDGGSLTNGTIVLNGCAVYPSFDPLLDEGLTIEDMPKAGTVKWDTTNGMPLWSNGENWVDATGNVVNEE